MILRSGFFCSFVSVVFYSITFYPTKIFVVFLYFLPSFRSQCYQRAVLQSQQLHFQFQSTSISVPHQEQGKHQPVVRRGRQYLLVQRSLASPQAQLRGEGVQRGRWREALDSEEQLSGNMGSEMMGESRGKQRKFS